MREARQRLSDALIQLGALPMTSGRVARVLCDTWLRDIVTGKVRPLIGARRIRMLEIDYQLTGPSEVVHFGLLDEDDFAQGDSYDKEIRQAARHALQEGWSAA